MNLSDVSTVNMISICWTHFVVLLIIVDDRVGYQPISRSCDYSGSIEIDEILYLTHSLKPDVIWSKT